MDLDMTLTERLLSGIAVILFLGFMMINNILQGIFSMIEEKMEYIREELQMLVMFQEQDHGLRDSDGELRNEWD